VNAQRATGEKIVLQINDKQGVAGFEFWNIHRLIIPCGVR
jgi:hypothetical protein